MRRYRWINTKCKYVSWYFGRLTVNEENIVTRTTLSRNLMRVAPFSLPEGNTRTCFVRARKQRCRKSTLYSSLVLLSRSTCQHTHTQTHRILELSRFRLLDSSCIPRYPRLSHMCFLALPILGDPDIAVSSIAILKMFHAKRKRSWVTRIFILGIQRKSGWSMFRTSRMSRLDKTIYWVFPSWSMGHLILLWEKTNEH